MSSPPTHWQQRPTGSRRQRSRDTMSVPRGPMFQSAFHSDSLRSGMTRYNSVEDFALNTLPIITSSGRTGRGHSAALRLAAALHNDDEFSYQSKKSTAATDNQNDVTMPSGGVTTPTSPCKLLVDLVRESHLMAFSKQQQPKKMVVYDTVQPNTSTVSLPRQQPSVTVSNSIVSVQHPSRTKSVSSESDKIELTPPSPTRTSNQNTCRQISLSDINHRTIVNTPTVAPSSVAIATTSYEVTDATREINIISIAMPDKTMQKVSPLTVSNSCNGNMMASETIELNLSEDNSSFVTDQLDATIARLSAASSPQWVEPHGRSSANHSTSSSSEVSDGEVVDGRHRDSSDTSSSVSISNGVVKDTRPSDELQTVQRRRRALMLRLNQDDSFNRPDSVSPPPSPPSPLTRRTLPRQSVIRRHRQRQRTRRTRKTSPSSSSSSVEGRHSSPNRLDHNTRGRGRRNARDWSPVVDTEQLGLKWQTVYSHQS